MVAQEKATRLVETYRTEKEHRCGPAKDAPPEKVQQLIRVGGALVGPACMVHGHGDDKSKVMMASNGG